MTGSWRTACEPTSTADFLALVRRWLKPGGRFAFIDSRPDPSSGAADQPVTSVPEAAAGIERRRLADGRAFRVVKIRYDAGELEAALRAAGFETTDVTVTPRFFVLGTAVA